MDQACLREWEAKCIQEEPASCKAGCPLEMDGRNFVSAMAAGDFKKARSVLDKHLPFPGIISRLCEAPCEQFCLRKDVGGSIDIRRLEQFCVDYEKSKSRMLRLPARPKSVLIIGGGPSALTAALDLSRKGFPVTLCHLGKGPGGWLCDLDEELLPRSVLENELERLRSLKVQFAPVSSLDPSLFGKFSHEAVYIGQDDHLSDDLLKSIDKVDREVFALQDEGKFTGGFSGVDHPCRFITDIFQGRQASLSIDRYLQGASLTAERPVVRHGKTDLYTNTTGISHLPRTLPARADCFEKAEAIKEAERCLRCECMECVNHCQYLQEYDGYPKSYAQRIYNNSAVVKGTRLANKMINSCSLCGQCEELCPNDFSMADLCLEARNQMVKENRMPPSAHWFALEEMRSARGEGSLAVHAVNSDTSKLLFFPGCQLAGIRPDQTLLVYDYLRKIEPETGIWLDCCGVPAHWAGRQEEFTLTTAELESVWQQMGCPPVVAACSTCLKMFSEHLPQIKVLSVWSMLLDNQPDHVKPGAAMALSDPCTSRHDVKTRQEVRKLLDKIGQPLVPLPMSENLTECCGFGGLMENANPELATKVLRRRGEQVKEGILTYCAMCRDQLAKNGKPAKHLLDIIFPEAAHSADEPSVLLSDRRINRRKIKASILARVPENEKVEPYPWEKFNLSISKEVAQTMDHRRILEDDVRQVIYYAMTNNHYLVHEKDGIRISSVKLGEVTFWVKYREDGDGFVLEACWSHRMQVQGGGA